MSNKIKKTCRKRNHKNSSKNVLHRSKRLKFAMDSNEESIPMYDENAEESAEPAAHHGGCLVRLERF